MNNTSAKQESRIRTIKAKIAGIYSYLTTIDAALRACEGEVNAILEDIATEKAEELKKTLAAPAIA